MTPIPIHEKMDDLTPEQLGLIDMVKQARMMRETATDAYARALRAANDGGISFGMLGYVLGVRKEALWRVVQRWLKRTNG